MAEAKRESGLSKALNAAWVRPFLFLIFIVVAWDLTIRVFRIPAYQIPAPGDVVAVLWTDWPELLRQAWPTTYATLCGFLLSALFGIPVAMLIAGSKTVEAYVYPLLVFSQSVPKIAIAPLFVVWFGFGIIPKVISAFLLGFFPVVVSAVQTVAITPADSMTQIWPLFLKKTGLKESDFQTVAGDGQTKLNAVINGQADLLLGYVMDQSMKIKDATGKDVNAIKFADYGINMVCSGVVANTEFVKANVDLVKRFMSATTKAVEAAEKDPKGAAQSILDANPKGGKIETLTKGFELTIPLYRTAETKSKRPFQVTDQNMTDTVNLMVEYGGLDAKAKDNPKAFYTNDYLPQGGS